MNQSAPTEKKYVGTAIEGHTAIVTIDNPPINALSPEVTRALSDTFEDLKRNELVRVVILTGKGRAFVAGANIRLFLEMDREKGEKYALAVTEMQQKIEEFNWPVIAAINGYALGGGCELAMACDIRIASSQAVFGQPEVHLGVIPGAGGTQRLPRLLPAGKAKMLLFTGKQIDASEAERIGLVDQVVPAGTEVQEALNLAREIMKVAPVALRFAKKAVNRGMQMSLHDALLMEATLFGELLETEDVKEGVQAFFEKREPRFKGR
ncbi:MAG: enoyl-CoA hydratase/isomerase family protein [Deltaproteobacteria bacterium]|nr:enoyl-CoA hydratase/isomerase family protein [Deltaproteobacteria bacterium]